MSMPRLNESGSLARRDLRREEMTRFGNEINWLIDPSQIPASATEISPRHGPFISTAVWMTESLAEWSAEFHNKLSYGEVFAKHGLDNDERVGIRTITREQATSAYGPGIVAVGGIIEVVPIVAVRGGKEQKHWGDIARKAKVLGKQLSVDGTTTQALVRTYLSPAKAIGSFSGNLDPAKVRLDDESGVSSVTPLPELIDNAKQWAADYMITEDGPGTCVALQANIEIGGRKVNVFDATWDAFCYFAENTIYPQLQIDPANVPAEMPPDPDALFLMEEICRAHVLEMYLDQAATIEPR